MAGQIQPVKPMIRPVGPKPSTSAPTITLREIYGIFRRHVLLIASFAIAGLILSGMMWYFMQRYFPKYTAKTAILVLSPGKFDPMVFTETQPNKDLAHQFRNTKAAFATQQSFLQELLKRDKIRETKWFKQFGTNKAEAIEKAEKDLRKHLKVGAERDRNWIRVSMTCGSKKESALIVNEMMDLFITQQYDIATHDISAQLKERKVREDIIKRDLKLAEDQLKALRTGTDFVNLEGGSFQNYLDKTLESTENQYNETEASISQLETNIAILSERAEGDYDAVMKEQMERDPISNNMRIRVSSLEPFLAQLLTRFGENHRLVRETREQLQQSKEDLAERQTEIADIQRQSNLQQAIDFKETMVSQLDTLRRQRESIKREYRELGSLRADYEKIAKRRDEQQQLLEKTREFIEKLNIQFRNPDISKVKPVGLAPEPLRMSSPNIKIYIPAGFMLGLMAGLGLTFAIELLNDLVRSPSDAAKHLPVRLLGMICHADEDEGIEDVDLYHVVRQAPYSIISECYRQFRTNLKLSGSIESHKTLFFTSCGAGCGKTSIAVNTTATFIAEDKKVLFIDTNFRKPASTNIFPRTEADGSVSEHPDFGLSNYLMGQCQDQDVIRPSGIEGLDIVDSGPLPSNPAELLGNVRMKQLLENGSQQYDYVIIDGPPLLVSDAKILAAMADGTIVVFNACSTRRGQAQRALRELRGINANIVGAVLLGVRSMKGGYFQEKFRLYQEYQQTQIAQPI